MVDMTPHKVRVTFVKNPYNTSYTDTTTPTDTTCSMSYRIGYATTDVTYTHITYLNNGLNQEEYLKFIKKLMKREKDKMCRNGWVLEVPEYPNFQVKPISLRGVCFGGRGWAN